LAKEVPDRLRAALGVGQRHDGVGVGVDDGLEREELVEQRLDRRPRRAGLLEAAGQVVHHLLVAHVLPLEEGQHVVETDSGKSFRAMLLRSEPLPFTRNTRIGRPRRSGSVSLIEVLPPPQTASEVSAPPLPLAVDDRRRHTGKGTL
jgi:hypothetical protein